MSLMASANHLLMVFIGVEMASLPSYALAGFLKGRRQSSEAALKYVVYGGGASGVMLYGISLLAGKFGTGYLPDLAVGFVAAMLDGTGAASIPVLVLGTLFILIGIGFKLAAVPFHFWCPDVFEGAAAEVAGFLSVASKGAALALLGPLRPGPGRPGAARCTCRLRHWLRMAQYLRAGPRLLRRPDGDVRQPGRLLADQPQTAAGLFHHRPRRLHDDGPGDAAPRRGVGAVLFYLVAYLFMNLGAFAVVAFLRNQTGSEDLQQLSAA